MKPSDYVIDTSSVGKIAGGGKRATKLPPLHPLQVGLIAGPKAMEKRKIFFPVVN
jgi:hypothetical protein